MLHFLRHWCYSCTTLLSANRNPVIFSCVLLGSLYRNQLYTEWYQIDGNDTISSQVKISMISLISGLSLKLYVIRWCIIETFSGLPRKSSAEEHPCSLLWGIRKSLPGSSGSNDYSCWLLELEDKNSRHFFMGQIRAKRW